MSNYNSYPCWDCSAYHNCGKTHIMNSYKFNRDGSCHAYEPSRLDVDDIIIEKRKRDFIKFIEYLEDNRIPRNRW